MNGMTKGSYGVFAASLRDQDLRRADDWRRRNIHERATSTPVSPAIEIRPRGATTRFWAWLWLRLGGAQKPSWPTAD